MNFISLQNIGKIILYEEYVKPEEAEKEIEICLAKKGTVKIVFHRSS